MNIAARLNGSAASDSIVPEDSSPASTAVEAKTMNAPMISGDSEVPPAHPDRLQDRLRVLDLAERGRDRGVQEHIERRPQREAEAVRDHLDAQPVEHLRQQHGHAPPPAASGASAASV